MSEPVLESSIQREAYEYALSRGWFAEKIMRTRRRGFPDYIYIRDGVVVFIEFKRPGEEPTAQQKLRHKEMIAHGATVYVVNNVDDAKRILH